MARSRKHRSKPIKEFKIPSIRTDMGEDEWEENREGVVWYGMPEEGRYRRPDGGRYKRCRIPAYGSNKDLLGYVPLPSRYRSAWVHLCKNVVFRLYSWKVWVAEAKEEGSIVPKPLLEEHVRDSGTKLLQYLSIRRMIVEELLRTEMGKADEEELEIFDEYLIRNANDWLWTESSNVPRGDQCLLGLDPVDEMNEGSFGQNYIPKSIDEDDEWEHGSAPDYAEEWRMHLGALIALANNPKYRDKIAERPWRENQEAPSVWHEGQEPIVEFLSEEEDKSAEKRVRESLGGQASDAGGERGLDGGEMEVDEQGGGEQAPQATSDSVIDPAILAEEQTNQGRLDNPTTRKAVEDYVRGEIEIPAVQDRIQSALGSGYNYAIWGKAVQELYREAEEEGERGTLTADEMFNRFIAPEQDRLDNLANMRSRQMRL